MLRAWLTVFFVVMSWGSKRLLVLAGFTARYFIAGSFVWNILRRVTKEQTKLFSASLAELLVVASVAAIATYCRKGIAGLASEGWRSLYLYLPSLLLY